MTWGIQQNSVKSIIEKCKNLNKIIVAGGPLFTSSYKDFTNIDHFILDELKKMKEFKDAKANKEFVLLVKNFEKHIETKKINVDKKKFKDKKRKIFNVDYMYLKNRYNALEKTICHFLGKKELGRIRMLYEEEMTDRILTAREHT